MHRVVGLIANEVVAIDLAIPAQVFGRGPAPYDWTVCAPGGPCAVPTENGFDVVVPGGLDALEAADTVIVPGIGDNAWPMPDAVLDALEAAWQRGARVASICTGAFVLAAAGLLDGRRATTHWRYARLLARRFVAETGTTPLQWLIGRRVAEAQRLLEGTELGIDAVADRCGLGSAAALRAHFGRITGTTPTAYRPALPP